MTHEQASCILCGAPALEVLFDLGDLPIGFPVAPERAAGLWHAPLTLAVCRRCALVQTVHQLPPDELLTETFYTSHGSIAIAEHDRRLADAVVSGGLATSGSLVLEIGCGDGSLLHALVDRGFTRVMGVEPSPHAGTRYGCEVLKGVFDEAMSARLRASGREPDLVIASHVLDGVPRPLDFIREVARALKPGAPVILEVPYFIDLTEAFRLDGFVHSRNVWFTLGAFGYAFERSGLRLDGVEHEPGYRGGSVRVIARKTTEGSASGAADRFLERETEALSAARFAAFRERIASHRARILAGLRSIREPWYVYGAGLKAATMLNWLGLNAHTVVCAVDNDPKKHGLVIPGTGLVVKPAETLRETQHPIAVLNLALDHRAEVEARLGDELPIGSLIACPLPAWECRPAMPRAQEMA
jgi:methylation protein EvaC